MLKLKIWFVQFHTKMPFSLKNFLFGDCPTLVYCLFLVLFFVFLKKKITRLRFHNVLSKVKRKINCYELSFKIKWNLLWLAHVVKHGHLKLTKFHVQKKNSIALCGCFNTIIFIIIIICFIHIMKFIFWVIVTLWIHRLFTPVKINK